MLLRQLTIAALAASSYAQSSSSIVLTGTNSVISGADYATGSQLSYESYTSTITLNTTSGAGASSTARPQNQTITTNGTALTTTSATQTLLSGSARNTTIATGRTATSSSARPTNTQPCNGYPEFCNRKYSNITQVGAHNSPFAIRGNIAANQELDVTTQLNDGVRMLQFQVHKPNDTAPLLLCHTSCDLLNAGTLVDYLTTVREWLDANPYDVVTILMGNYDVLTPQNFTGPVYESGLDRYAYTPPTVPMPLNDWPTLGEMILTQKRAVIMLDYEADQVAIPWLLDEFANFWETPFSPTDRDFPCNVDRPPNQDREISRDRLYIANHNLNVDVQIAGLSLLIPASTLLNETNAVQGYGSAGAMVNNCTADWARPPTVILVDFYNIGSFNGSVFQVAADANGVSYNRDSCCGTMQRTVNAATSKKVSSVIVAAAALAIAYMMV